MIMASIFLSAMSFLVIALHPMDNSTVAVRVGICGVDVQGLVVVGDGGIDIAALPVGQAPVPVRLGIFQVQADGLRQIADGLVESRCQGRRSGKIAERKMIHQREGKSTRLCDSWALGCASAAVSDFIFPTFLFPSALSCLRLCRWRFCVGTRHAGRGFASASSSGIPKSLRVGRLR